MSTPIYDALCEAMPGPSGPDEEDAAVTAQGTDVGGATEQDRHGDVAATANGEVSTARDGDGAAVRNGRVESGTAAGGTRGSVDH